jgi:hypothetical protein
MSLRFHFHPTQTARTGADARQPWLGEGLLQHETRASVKAEITGKLEKKWRWGKE